MIRSFNGKHLIEATLLILALVGFTACNYYEESLNGRAEKAKTGTGDITIGIVGQKGHYLKGVELAVEQVNLAGGVLRRKLSTVFYDDKRNQELAKHYARKFADNHDIVAVIGHLTSSTAIPASITYENCGILFISPGATNPNLTNHGFKYVFRNIPSDVAIGRAIGDKLLELKVKDIVLLYKRSLYGKRLGEIIYERIDNHGINVVSYKSYLAKQTDFSDIIVELKKLKFDMIVVAGGMPDAGLLIKQSRLFGIEQHFIGGDGLDNLKLWDIAESYSNGTYAASVFNPTLKTRKLNQFKEDFVRKYQQPPDTWAAQGFDAIMLLANTYTKANTILPLKAANRLRYTLHWEGVTGVHKFTKNGDVTGKPVTFKRMLNGKFTFKTADDETED